MKKLFTILLISNISVAAFGQFEWVFDNPHSDDFAYKLVKTKGNQYALLHGWDYPTGLTVLDSTGSTLFTFDGDGAPFALFYFTDVIELPGNSIAVTALGYGVDTLSGEGYEFGALLKLNQAGDVIQSMQDFSQYFDIGASLSDESYILVDMYSQEISRWASDGSKAWQKVLTGYNVINMAVKSTDTIVIATEQGLLIMDEDGNMTASYPYFIFDRVKMNTQDGIVGVQGDSIFLLSQEYSLLSSIGFQGDNIKDFAVEGDSIAVLTESSHVYRYNGSLSFLNSFQLLDDVEFDFIDISPKRLVLSGTERYGEVEIEKGTSSSFVKEYSFEGDDYDLSRDVGVVGVVQGPETVVTQQTSSHYNATYKNVKVTVRNFGDEPVESLYLRSKQYRSQKFDSLSLQPGAEVELIWEELELSYYFNPADSIIDVCIWTSHPDFRLDTDAGNDSYCSDFIVSDEEVVAQNSLAIYPNPASDVLNFQLLTSQPATNSTFRIINAEGKLMKAFEGNRLDATFTVQVRDWAAGVYFLQYLEEGAIQHSERFVIAK